MKNISSPSISSDRPLVPSSSISEDKLQRSGFALAAVSALRRVSADEGFVISIEGPWGSGKSSTLSMMESIMTTSSFDSCVIVHFNPWLIGCRDSLLRGFFNSISAEISLPQHARTASRVSKELKNYSSVFDLIKWVPGAEPWASIVKGVVQSAGGALGGVAEQNSLDLEAQKLRLEEALREFGKSIYVFIDDVDRLFPKEVFEVVRIIKAIGDLPNLGYVVAWDPEYIRQALDLAGVPMSSSYIDKIVQVRLPLPAISASARIKLLNDGLADLADEAHHDYFPGQDERLRSIYLNGVRDLLEHPRDVARVINTLNVIEPELRGEIVLADLLGLSCLMVRAPRVYDALRRDHSLFTSPVDSNSKEEVRLARVEKLRSLFATAESLDAIEKVVAFLFPNVAKALGKFSYAGSLGVHGHLAAPGRLGIALGMAIGGEDVSLVDARRFLLDPQARIDIEKRINSSNGLGFLEMLGDVASMLESEPTEGLEKVCLSISQLVDKVACVFADGRRPFFTMPAEDLAVVAIRKLVRAVSPRDAERIALAIIRDKGSLSVAAEIVSASLSSNNEDGEVVCPKLKLPSALRGLCANACELLESNQFWGIANPSRVLWVVMRGSASSATKLFKKVKEMDPSLDSFALHFLKHSYSSNGGQSYAFPDDPVANNMVKLKVLQRHARVRLQDSSLTYPLKAAWKAVVEETALYGSDGSDARR